MKCAGYIEGYKRRFWLASTDHRGVPESPGRVCTLIASEDSKEKVWGVAYEVPTDDKTQNDLDYREKGGYTRHATIFHRTSSTETTNTDSDVCVGGAIPSPECHSISLQNESLNAPSDIPASIPVVVFIASSDVEEYLGPQSLESIADVISNSVGPSGKNSDYLLNLAEAARTLFPGVDDAHLYELERLVKERMK